MLRIIKRAGLESCPKLFHNLRGSRETELTAQFPRHVVCQWIGNSQVIAATHYLQVTDNHFAEAVEGSARSAAHVKQVVKQQAATSDCPDSQETKKARVNRANCMPVQLAALPCSQTKYPQGGSNNYEFRRQSRVRRLERCEMRRYS
jgi:hypothetical protein